jgi:prevent-host-death family protein
MEKQIGLTEARGKFSDIVNEVLYQGDTYVISKQGKPAVAVVPLNVLEQWRKQREKVFAVIDRIHLRNADAPAAQMDEEEFMDTINDLVSEVREQMKTESTPA